jgi:hypothetical protein
MFSAYENMITANYRSQYDAKAFLATFYLLQAAFILILFS